MEVEVKEAFKVGEFELLKIGGGIIIERGTCGKKPCGHNIFSFGDNEEV